MVASACRGWPCIHCCCSDKINCKKKSDKNSTEAEYIKRRLNQMKIFDLKNMEANVMYFGKKDRTVKI